MNVATARGATRVALITTLCLAPGCIFIDCRPLPPCGCPTPLDNSFCTPQVCPAEGEGEWDPDTDGDGLSDAEEQLCGSDQLDFLDVCPTHDSDGDGIADVDESERGTDRFDPDTDDDGFTDGDELACGSSPLDPWLVCPSGEGEGEGEGEGVAEGEGEGEGEPPCDP